MKPFTLADALAALPSFRPLTETDYYAWADAQETDKIGYINEFEVLWCADLNELQWLGDDFYGYAMSLTDGSIVMG